MTELIAPQPGERCNDPACGTFGFSGIKLLAPLVSIVNGIPALATNMQKFIDFATQFLSRI